MELSQVAYGADFYMMWSAGHAALQGHSAYDQALLRQSMAELGVYFNDPVIGYLPWTLWMFVLMAKLPFNTAWALWELAILCSLLFFIFTSARIITESLDIGRIGLFPLIFTAIAFPPLLNNLRWGQSNFMLALGIAGYLLFEMQGKHRQAGLCLSLVSWKPHLQLPLWAFLLTRSLKDRNDRSAFCWCGLGVLTQLTVSFFLTPASVLSYPNELLRTFEVSAYPMPCISLMLAAYAGFPSLRYVIPVFGAIWGSAAGLRIKNARPEDCLFLLSLGLLTTPYCWSHSFVLLYPLYLYAFCLFYRYSRQFALGIFASGGLVQYFLTYEGPFDRYMVALPVVLFILFALRYRSLRNGGVDAARCAVSRAHAPP